MRKKAGQRCENFWEYKKSGVSALFYFFFPACLFLAVLTKLAAGAIAPAVVQAVFFTARHAKKQRMSKPAMSK